MLQIREAFDEAKTPDLYLQIPPAGSAPRLAPSQSGGLGGPRRGGLPDHDVAFAGPSTQIEEDPRRLRRSHLNTARHALPNLCFLSPSCHATASTPLDRQHKDATESATAAKL
jgi:hypothetical protein